MGSLKSTSDIKKATLKRCGELTDGSSAYDSDVLDYINTNYHSILAGGTEFDVDLNENWIWAQSAKPMIITLEPARNVTATVTKGSTTLTLSIPITDSVAGFFLRVDNNDQFAQYQALTHVAGTSTVTLDQAYLGSSGTYPARLIKLDYLLSQPVLRLINPALHYVNTQDSNKDVGKIFGIDAATMISDYPMLRIGLGIPDRFCIQQQSEQGIHTLRFNAYPLESMRIEIPYVPIQADLIDSPTNYPLIPFAFRDCLMHMAAFMIMLDKSDDRSDVESKIAQSKLMSMKNSNRKALQTTGRSFGRLIPRLGGLRKVWGSYGRR